MKKSYRLLVASIALCGAFAVVPREARAAFYVVEAIADYGATAVQKSPVWCWAASIQMSLKSQGIMWQQEDIVARVKGYLKNETANAYEMTAFLNSWNMDYNGRVWKANAKWFKGAPSASSLVNELKNKRPVIVTYNTGPASGHAVVVYGALASPGKGISLIYYFDPYTGKKGTISPDRFTKSVTNSWLVRVS